MAPSRTVARPNTLLAYLLEAWAPAKRVRVLGWLKHRAVLVNGRTISQFDHALQVGDVVALRPRGDAAPGTIVGAQMRIRHDDADVTVIEKPSGLLAIASAGERERSAYFQLTSHVRGNNPRARIWVVHRLDRETSGLMVFARTAEAKHILQTGWDRVEKHYLAIVEGRPPLAAGTFASDLDERDPWRVRSGPAGPNTRHAVTHYSVVRSHGGRSLVELRLVTGRRHQIRVHLGDAGCPVVGDRRYGAATDPVRRVALHASHLRFAHPRTGVSLAFHCPLPGELGALV